MLKKTSFSSILLFCAVYGVTMFLMLSVFTATAQTSEELVVGNIEVLDSKFGIYKIRDGLITCYVTGSSISCI